MGSLKLQKSFEFTLTFNLPLEHLQDRQKLVSLLGFRRHCTLFQTKYFWVENRLLKWIVTLDECLFKIVDQDVLSCLFHLSAFLLKVIKRIILIYRWTVLASSHAVFDDLTRCVFDFLL